MRENRSKFLSVVIAMMMIGIGVFSAFTLEINVKDGAPALSIYVVLLLIGLALALVSFRGYLKGVGGFALEWHLDQGIAYDIDKIVDVGNGFNLFLLREGPKADVKAVMVAGENFKKFEILNKEYLVPKKFKAKIVDGRLLMPVRRG